MDERLKLRAYAHDYLHGINLASRHNTNALHVSNSHALQVHRLPLAQALGIVKISDQRNFSGEDAARSAYQEDEKGQGQRTDDYGYSDL